MINGSHGVLVRHRLRSGAAAARANVTAAGRSVVTGHTQRGFRGRTETVH
jgi:hypothetical protein